MKDFRKSWFRGQFFSGQTRPEISFSVPDLTAVILRRGHAQYFRKFHSRQRKMNACGACHRVCYPDLNHNNVSALCERFCRHSAAICHFVAFVDKKKDHSRVWPLCGSRFTILLIDRCFPGWHRSRLASWVLRRHVYVEYECIHAIEESELTTE